MQTPEEFVNRMIRAEFGDLAPFFNPDSRRMMIDAVTRDRRSIVRAIESSKEIEEDIDTANGAGELERRIHQRYTNGGLQRAMNLITEWTP